MAMDSTLAVQNRFSVLNKLFLMTSLRHLPPLAAVLQEPRLDLGFATLIWSLFDELFFLMTLASPSFVKQTVSELPSSSCESSVELGEEKWTPDSSFAMLPNEKELDCDRNAHSLTLLGSESG